MEELLFDILTASVEETEAVGETLARRIAEEDTMPRFVALYGDLGVGKTAFVRGFARVLAPESAVRSPTLSIVNEYRARPLSVFHFDLYRIEDEDDLYSVGYDDYLLRPGVCIAEWCEKIPYALPRERIAVTIEKNDPSNVDSRHVQVSLLG